MTVFEQIATWAAAPDNEILVGVTYDDTPCVVVRLKVRDALAGFGRRLAEINVVRLAEHNGIACIVVDGTTPNPPHAAYRAVLSPAESFQ